MRLLAPHQAIDQLRRRLGVREAREIGQLASPRAQRVALRQQLEIAIGLEIEHEPRARERLERDPEAARRLALFRG